MSAADAETEEERTKRESYRANIVKEIVASEERYVGCLRTMVDFYCTPLQEAIQNGTPVITQALYDSIFQNTVSYTHLTLPTNREV